MDQAASSWVPSIANIAYTFVLTVAAIVSIFVVRRNKDRDLDYNESISVVPVPTAGLAKRWHGEWEASQAEVTRLESDLRRVRDERESFRRKLETSEMERTRIENKAALAEQTQSSILGKLDVIKDQIEKFRESQ